MTLDEEMEAHCLAVEEAYRVRNEQDRIERIAGWDKRMAEQDRKWDHAAFLKEYFRPTKGQRRTSPFHAEVAVKVPQGDEPIAA